MTIVSDGYLSEGPGPVLPLNCTNTVFETIGEIFWQIHAPEAATWEDKRQFIFCIELWIANGEIRTAIEQATDGQSQIAKSVFIQFANFLNNPEEWPNLRIGLVLNDELVSV